MKIRLFIVCSLLLVSACAPFKHAPYLDDEFGKGSQAAWDAQIINKNNPHAEKIPAEMSGIAAEEVMDVRTKMFAEKPRRSSFFEFLMGR